MIGVPSRTAMLSTIQAETTALQLYRKRGWLVLLDHFMFPNTPAPFQIMGLDLQAYRARQAVAQHERS